MSPPKPPDLAEVAELIAKLEADHRGIVARIQDLRERGLAIEQRLAAIRHDTRAAVDQAARRLVDGDKFDPAAVVALSMEADSLKVEHQVTGRAIEFAAIARVALGNRLSNLRAATRRPHRDLTPL